MFCSEVLFIMYHCVLCNSKKQNEMFFKFTTATVGFHFLLSTLKSRKTNRSSLFWGDIGVKSWIFYFKNFPNSASNSHQMNWGNFYGKRATQTEHARTFHCTPWGGRRVTDTGACDVISLGQQRLWGWWLWRILVIIMQIIMTFRKPPLSLNEHLAYSQGE